MIDILVDIRSFKRVTRWHVRRVLSCIPESDLRGLGSIRIIDDCPDDPESLKVPSYLRGFLYNGHYSRSSNNKSAEIVLYANDIWFGIPKLLKFTPMATIKVARTLAHEVGHHIIATRGYILHPSEQYKQWSGIRDPHEERMVDSYATNLLKQMQTRWLYKFGHSMAVGFSYILYQAGLQNYWDGNYMLAAEREARAHSLNPSNEDAGQCFRHAMEKLKIQTPSPLNRSELEWIRNRYIATPEQAGELHS